VWEFVEGQAWESVQEDVDGNIIGKHGTGISAADIYRRRRRQRARHDAAGGRRVVRDMIRYMYLLIDMSASMSEKDPVLAPGNRLSCTVAFAIEFVSEFYDQNPISHLGIVIMKDGEAEMLTQLSGNPKVHMAALARASGTGSTSAGELSLQNGLEVAGRSLGHMPKHGSREVVVLCGALSTCDPGDLIAETLPKLKQANIRVSCIALVAEMHICRRISEETNGTMNVCLDKNHFRDLFMAQCVPPPATRTTENDDLNGERTCEFVQMGFPTRETSDVPSLIHITKEKKRFSRTGYVCPRCKAKACELPTDCAVCGLKLVLSPHLARTFHHLFPVPAFGELGPSDMDVGETVSSADHVGGGGSGGRPRARLFVPVDATLLITSKDCPRSCFGCLRFIGVEPPEAAKPKAKYRKRGSKADEAAAAAARINLRFQCPDCDNIFCSDCDAYLHETLHNCPGCLCAYS